MGIHKSTLLLILMKLHRSVSLKINVACNVYAIPSIPNPCHLVDENYSFVHHHYKEREPKDLYECYFKYNH